MPTGYQTARHREKGENPERSAASFPASQNSRCALTASASQTLNVCMSLTAHAPPNPLLSAASGPGVAAPAPAPARAAPHPALAKLAPVLPTDSTASSSSAIRVSYVQSRPSVEPLSRISECEDDGWKEREVTSSLCDSEYVCTGAAGARTSLHDMARKENKCQHECKATRERAQRHAPDLDGSINTAKLGTGGQRVAVAARRSAEIGCT